MTAVAPRSSVASGGMGSRTNPRLEIWSSRAASEAIPTAHRTAVVTDRLVRGCGNGSIVRTHLPRGIRQVVRRQRRL